MTRNNKLSPHPIKKSQSLKHGPESLKIKKFRLVTTHAQQASSCYTNLSGKKSKFFRSRPPYTCLSDVRIWENTIQLLLTNELTQGSPQPIVKSPKVGPRIIPLMLRVAVRTSPRWADRRTIARHAHP